MSGRKKETIHIKVDPEFREMLDAFSEANFGAPHSELFRRAFIAFKDFHLDKDEAMNSRYRQAQAEIKRDKIKVVSKREGLDERNATS